MRVAVFVGTRADLGPLEPVIAACASAADIELHVLCGVALEARTLGERLRETASHDGPVVALADPIGDVTSSAMLSHGAAITLRARDLFSRRDFDALVVLGDRWELLYVVPAAVLSGIRIVHIHGGEVTEGALDERVRHAVTKLADIHCVASADAAGRVRRMGEADVRIRVTGAPGLDRIVGSAPMGDDELARLLGGPVRRPLALFTYHPPTAEPHAELGRWAADALEGALSHCGCVIVTAPGMDPGRDEIMAAIDRVVAADPRAVWVPSLGPVYPAVLAAVDVVVGNSSSGVIEAASAGVPAVDIGLRQAGRLRAVSVLHADDARQSVEDAVVRALTPEVRELARRRDNPYGDGKAAARIVAAIEHVTSLPIAKPFTGADGHP